MNELLGTPRKMIDENDLIEYVAHALAENEPCAFFGDRGFDWEKDTTRFQKEQYRKTAALTIFAAHNFRTAKTEHFTFSDISLRKLKPGTPD